LLGIQKTNDRRFSRQVDEQFFDALQSEEQRARKVSTPATPLIGKNGHRSGGGLNSCCNALS
jgi:hypothetical protein